MRGDERLSHITFLELVILIFTERDLLACNLDPKPIGSVTFAAVIVRSSRHIYVLRFNWTAKHLLLASTKILRKPTKSVQKSQRGNAGHEAQGNNHCYPKES